MAMKVELDFSKELEKTVLQSLATSFGLDFLLLEDKKGGDVDTIHNVRQGIYATDKEKEAYANRGDYYQTTTNKNGNIVKKDIYHQDPVFRDKAKKTEDQKIQHYDDAYQNKTNLGKDVQLDHVVSSNEIHNDPARTLAGVDGREIASSDDNLAFTQKYVNNRKSNLSMTEFAEKIPKIISDKKNKVQKDKEKLKSMPANTPEERSEKQKLEDKIRKNEYHIQELEACDKEKMLERDKLARTVMNKKYNWEYYTSSKFFKNTALASGKVGLQMGARQALGLIVGEVWFELREQIPHIYKKQKQSFSIEQFFKDIFQALKNIWQRVKERFKDIITTFKDSAIGGMLSSITTTILNMFLTTQKLIGKLIREMFNSLVSVIKLIFFNPDNLSFKELCKACLKLLSGAVATILGSMLYTHLVPLFTFPFGDAFASFISALATGLMTLAFCYYIDGGDLAKDIWNFLFQKKNQYTLKVEYMQKINNELDQYLLKLAKLKFNMNPMELESFAFALSGATSDLDRKLAIQAEVERRNIVLPYEMGNLESVRNFLRSKMK